MSNTSIPHKGAQKGVVLLIALIALVALTLTGLALVRSVNATNEITGNIIFRQSSLTNSDRALNIAVDKILVELAAADASGNPRNWADYGSYYSATLFPTEYSATHTAACAATAEPNCLKLSGIPNRLMPAYTNGRCQSAADATAIATASAAYDSTSGNCTMMVMERMCTQVGPPSAAWCVQLSNAGTPALLYDQSHGGDNKEGQISPPPTAVAVRVTIRVDGPRGTTSYIQSILAM